MVDLVSTFAFPVSFQVICDLLGLPGEDRERFRHLASARFDVTQGGSGTIGAVSQSREFLMEATAKQRREPGPGLIGQIVREHGDEINDFDLAGLADGVFTGGLETTASMLALGTAVLLEHRDDYLRLPDDPAHAERTVEELLRYLTVVQVAFPRFPKQDVEVAGHRFAKGDVVICHLAGANRDPRALPDAEEFRASRDPRSHLAFGHGFHRCVGAALARLELGIAYPALARRFPDLQLEAPTRRGLPADVDRVRRGAACRCGWAEPAQPSAGGRDQLGAVHRQHQRRRSPRTGRRARRPSPRCSPRPTPGRGGADRASPSRAAARRRATCPRR